MDVLSEVLKVVKLEGAVYYNGEFSAPWSFRSPASRRLAPYLAPDAGHVIIYHLITEGRGYAEIRQGTRVPLGPGDIVVFPHGDPHMLGNGPVRDTVNSERELERILSKGFKLVRMGGGGEITRIVCGYMACEPRLSRLFLAGLPPVFKVNIRSDASGQWLENSILFSVAEADSARAGGEAVLAKLSEALFVETLRRYIAQLPSYQTGWLAGARDPEVGNALALMHRRPAHPWTIAGLACEAGISRSVLAERFRQYLGEPPMAYLTRWRLQLGAQMLKSTGYSVAQIAAEVGYESEPAFNRAFKRQFNLPPARFRAESKSVRDKPGKSPSRGSAVRP
ncbi:MAG TPA: AraC family transcriptional regulator [Candidatus Limnocylindrales bacterium]|nr:AraC family transcriptional regulator [Candidatus Limnocylindrales bacterium]